MKESLSLLRNYNKGRCPLLSSGFSRSFAAEPRRGVDVDTRFLASIKIARRHTATSRRAAAMAAFAKSGGGNDRLD
jgi:hypothetical protein